jgi:murein DD-endopeptidase MepM/ murein hydrolase activator NlpD
MQKLNLFMHKIFSQFRQKLRQIAIQRVSIVLGLLFLTSGLGVLGFSSLSSQAQVPQSSTLRLSVTPSQPELGDTLTVITRSPNGQRPVVQPPVIQMGNQTYPAYPISNDRFRALIPTTPLTPPGKLQIQAQMGNDRQTTSLTLRSRSFPTQRIWLPDGQDGNVSDWEYDQVDAFKKTVSPEKFWSGPFLRPNNGGVSSIYGIRRYYNGVFADDYFHRGVDYAGDEGSAIVAPAAGRITFIGYEKDGFKVHGNIIGMDHGQGVLSVFLHLSRIQVKRGDFVKAGQTIGQLGDTGAATGPHLHWGLYVNGQAVDPTPWREQGFE